MFSSAQYFLPTTSSTMPRPTNEPNPETETTTTTTTTHSKSAKFSSSSEFEAIRRRRKRSATTLFRPIIFILFIFLFSSDFYFLYGDAAPVADALLIYSTDNDHNNVSTNFNEISRNAFLSLTGKPVEARFPTYHIVNNNKINNAPKHHHHRKKHRKNRVEEGDDKEGKETILDGRKHALMQLADPQALKMQTKCDGQKFKQRVRVDGCLTKVVVNRLCHGTCASFFIPRMHSKKLKAAFKSCATCAPSDYDFVDITLDCPGQTPPTATRTIVKVKSCKCREVSISSLYA